ncbi:hypothetical protein GPX89_30320 [Nocardia sp. ET3-3]|uniref:Uncharacterized protein n=1 Tax=Nocardia terrae TaxID=2675851 RepID=A0A7K1V4E4_9NOCA|nr:hypothetical protein [Nocardia terrae]
MRAGALVAAGAFASALTMAASGIAAAEPATDITVDGTYVVNVDIKPGIYIGDGSPDPANGGCFWRRLWKIQTAQDYPDPNYYIIASDFVRTKPVTVEIKATDVGFSTVNCGAWHLTPAQPNTGSAG